MGLMSVIRLGGDWEGLMAGDDVAEAAERHRCELPTRLLAQAPVFSGPTSGMTLSPSQYHLWVSAEKVLDGRLARTECR